MKFENGKVAHEHVWWDQASLLVQVGLLDPAELPVAPGFFFSMLPPTATQPTGAVSLIYVGAVILAASVLTLAVGFIRTPA